MTICISGMGIISVLVQIEVKKLLNACFSSMNFLCDVVEMLEEIRYRCRLQGPLMNCEVDFCFNFECLLKAMWNSLTFRGGRSEHTKASIMSTCTSSYKMPIKSDNRVSKILVLTSPATYAAPCHPSSKTFHSTPSLLLKLTLP